MRRVAALGGGRYDFDGCQFRVGMNLLGAVLIGEKPLSEHLDLARDQTEELVVLNFRLPAGDPIAVEGGEQAAFQNRFTFP